MLSHHSGPRPAKIAIVGKALTASDLREGRPFSGETGLILDNCLTQANLFRGSIFCTNLFSSKQESGFNKHLTLTKGKLTFASDVFRKEQSRLRDELIECQPNVVVPLGNEALYALTERIGISKWHGSILESTLIPGLKVIPTFHPSAAVVQGRYDQADAVDGAGGAGGAFLNRYYIGFDLIKVAGDSEYPELRLPNPTYYLNPTVSEAVDYLESCHELPIVGSDIETCYLDKPNQSALTHWAIAKSGNEAMCIPFVKGMEDNYTAQSEGKILKAIHRLSINPNVAILGQNYIFDSSTVLNYYNLPTNQIRDTLVAQAILFPELRRGLDTLTAQYTRFPYYKKDGKEYLPSLAKSVPDEKFRLYNALDTVALFPIHDAQVAMLKQIGLYDYYLHKCYLIEALLQMSHNGMAVDLARRSDLDRNAAVQIDALLKAIYADVGFELNPNSPKQLQEYFYGKLGISPYKTYDKKLGRSKATCSETALKSLANNKGIKVAELINRYRSIRTKRSTFYCVQLDPDNRLRCQYNPIGGGVSRLSSSKTAWRTGQNMQNQPPELKYCLAPDEGYYGISIDLAQAENRIVAYVWNVYEMINAFESGIDVHSLTAALIFGVPIEEISRKKGSTTIGMGKYSQRDIGKRCNHAFNYGFGARSFSQANDTSEKDAKWIYNSYFKVYPEIKAGHENTLSAIRNNNRWIGDLMGYKRRFLGDMRNSTNQRAAYAFRPQSTVGNKTNKHGLCHIMDNPETFKDVRLSRQVHDSIDFLYPIDGDFYHMAEVLKSSATALEQPLTWEGTDFIIPADISIGLRNFGHTQEFRATGKSVEKLAAEFEHAFWWTTAYLRSK